MSHVEQLEREAEQTRAQIAGTLDELKESMTPSYVLHQLADRINDGAPAAFARNLRDQAVNNPLSVALIGAGMAWLMLSPLKSNGNAMRRSAERLRDAGDAAQQRAAEAADAGRGTAESAATAARQTATEAADALRDAAGSASDSVQRTASSGYQAMAETAVRTADRVSASTRDATQRTLQSGSAFLDFCREQPMIIAGLGLAMGAMVGALLPSSETEDQLMGQASDRAKERAKNVAAEQYESAKKVGERALDAAKDEAAEATKQATGQEQAGGSQEQERHAETKSDDATLVPSHEAEPDARGQPWSADNAPV
jgi:hypothetical protein